MSGNQLLSTLRAEFAAQFGVNSHVGEIDPSDGIEFRHAVLYDEEPERRRRGLNDRCIYRKKRRWRVLIRFHGRLYDLRTYSTFALARAARDRFYAAAYGSNWRSVVLAADTAERVARGSVDAARSAFAKMLRAPRG